MAGPHRELRARGLPPPYSNARRNENAPPDFRVGRTAFGAAKPQNRRSGYRTLSAVTARPIIMRWISLVPSKMVKFSGLGFYRLAGIARRSGHGPGAFPGIAQDG